MDRETQEDAMVTYRRRKVQGLNIFYREAGDPAAPTLVLLHGYPSSSFMFRQLIPALEDQFHLIAPDYPGFGNSEAPPPSQFAYTFEHLADVMEGLLDGLDIQRFGIYIQDYGAPVGTRIATRRPEAIQAVIVQNGNAYEEGFSPAWGPLREGLWRQRTAQTEAAVVEAFASPEGIKANWTAGARDPEGLSPDGWNMDRYFMAQRHRQQLQLELMYDYRHNPDHYPEFQAFLRQHPPGADRLGRAGPLLYRCGRTGLPA
jgi:pimeloyl-ACP methyl ester carboxylesterase